MKRIYLHISLIAITLLFFACGGGGGGDEDDSTPTDLSTVFDLKELNSLDEHVIYAFDLTGSDSDGHNWVGTISSEIEPIVNIGGIDLIPEVTQLSLIDLSTNAPLSDTQIVYWNLAEEPDRLIFIESGVICNPVSINPIPDQVMIGDSGDLTSFTCSDGTQLTGTWSVENANDGHAFLLFDGIIMDGSSTIVGTQTDKYKIDAAGSIISVSFSVYDVDRNYTLDLSS